MSRKLTVAALILALLASGVAVTAMLSVPSAARKYVRTHQDELRGPVGERGPTGARGPEGPEGPAAETDDFSDPTVTESDLEDYLTKSDFEDALAARLDSFEDCLEAELFIWASNFEPYSESIGGLQISNLFLSCS